MRRAVCILKFIGDLVGDNGLRVNGYNDVNGKAVGRDLGVVAVDPCIINDFSRAFGIDMDDVMLRGFIHPRRTKSHPDFFFRLDLISFLIIKCDINGFDGSHVSVHCFLYRIKYFGTGNRGNFHGCVCGESALVCFDVYRHAVRLSRKGLRRHDNFFVFGLLRSVLLGA